MIIEKDEQEEQDYHANRTNEIFNIDSLKKEIGSDTLHEIHEDFINTLVTYSIPGTNLTIDLPENYKIEKTEYNQERYFTFSPRDPNLDAQFLGIITISKYPKMIYLTNSHKEIAPLKCDINHLQHQWRVFYNGSKFTTQTILKEKSKFKSFPGMHFSGEVYNLEDLYKLVFIYSTLSDKKTIS